MKSKVIGQTAYYVASMNNFAICSTENNKENINMKYITNFYSKNWQKQSQSLLKLKSNKPLGVATIKCLVFVLRKCQNWHSTIHSYVNTSASLFKIKTATYLPLWQTFLKKSLHMLLASISPPEHTSSEYELSFPSIQILNDYKPISQWSLATSMHSFIQNIKLPVKVLTNATTCIINN